MFLQRKDDCKSPRLTTEVSALKGAHGLACILNLLHLIICTLLIQQWAYFGIWCIIFCIIWLIKAWGCSDWKLNRCLFQRPKCDNCFFALHEFFLWLHQRLKGCRFIKNNFYDSPVLVRGIHEATQLSLVFVVKGVIDCSKLGSFIRTLCLLILCLKKLILYTTSSDLKTSKLRLFEATSSTNSLMCLTCSWVFLGNVTTSQRYTLTKSIIPMSCFIILWNLEGARISVNGVSSNWKVHEQQSKLVFFFRFSKRRIC